MKYAIISDIHSNIEALNKVLSEIDRLGIKQIISPGDIIGYNPFADECVKIFRERNIKTVLGNHDALAVKKIDRFYFNRPEMTALERNIVSLSKESLSFIKKLKRSEILGDLLLVHARPPGNFTDCLTISNLKKEFFKKKITIIGHTHIPAVYRYKDKIKEIKKKKVKLDKDARYILNPGSVGQPRDDDPRASFGILTDDYFEIKRVKYDVKKTADEIKERGYPDIFYERLEKGK